MRSVWLTTALITVTNAFRFDQTNCPFREAPPVNRRIQGISFLASGDQGFAVAACVDAGAELRISVSFVDEIGNGSGSRCTRVPLTNETNTMCPNISDFVSCLVESEGITTYCSQGLTLLECTSNCVVQAQTVFWCVPEIGAWVTLDDESFGTHDTHRCDSPLCRMRCGLHTDWRDAPNECVSDETILTSALNVLQCVDADAPVGSLAPVAAAPVVAATPAPFESAPVLTTSGPVASPSDPIDRPAQPVSAPLSTACPRMVQKMTFAASIVGFLSWSVF